MKDFVELYGGWEGEIFEEICEEIREIVAAGLEEGTASEPRKLETDEEEPEAWWWVYRATNGKYCYQEFGGKPDGANDVPYLVIWKNGS